MSALSALYQHLILEHSRNPRHFERLARATHTARRENPFCGDEYSVDIELASDRIVRVGFEGAGCAISKASASMLAVSIENKSLSEVEALSSRFYRLIRGKITQSDGADALAELGSLIAFAAVAEFPARIACARLAWEVLEQALASSSPQSSEPAASPRLP